VGLIKFLDQKAGILALWSLVLMLRRQKIMYAVSDLQRSREVTLYYQNMVAAHVSIPILMYISHVHHLEVGKFIRLGIFI
jgi:hypothetical protein